MYGRAKLTLKLTNPNDPNANIFDGDWEDMSHVAMALRRIVSDFNVNITFELPSNKALREANDILDIGKSIEPLKYVDVVLGINGTPIMSRES